MLKQIRENARIPLYILIVAFIGLYAVSSHETSPAAGKVFGKRVQFSDFKKSYIAARTQMIMKYGDLPRDPQVETALEEQAWDRIILLAQAKKERVKVDDKEIVAFVKKIDAFNDKDGWFSKKLYEEILRYNFGLTPTEFERIVRENLTIEKLIDKHTKTAAVTDEEALKQYRYLNEKVKADYILAKTSDYLTQVSAPDEETKAYFEKNKEAFRIPERVNVEYIVKPFADDKEETKEKARKEALEISYELAANKDLAAAAKKFSLSIKETGLFDEKASIPLVGYDLKFAGAAFALEEGAVGNPIETKSGIYFMKLKQRVPERDATYEESADKARAALKSEKAGTIAKAKAEEALAEIQKGIAKFGDVAKKLSLHEKKTNPFVPGQYIEGIGISPDFADAALSVKPGEVVGEVVKVNNGYTVIRLDSITPIDEKKYEADKEKFKELLIAQKQFFASLSWYDDLKKKANLEPNLPSRP
ncbi:MAG TPA: peptidylprolyl isomerase [Candidatus Omnitrophota bacterium]|nr:peptidylprolyl isomerase [Candidatus Omnitrophota bacterium]MDD5738298.1 peptidylprolyl isomerase [Candidatus Omnitrophota bacterium]HPN66241.1 peptidylprolyl isomerase [Candidatus Omnitrophota bacterium]